MKPGLRYWVSFRYSSLKFWAKVVVCRLLGAGSCVRFVVYRLLRAGCCEHIFVYRFLNRFVYRLSCTGCCVREHLPWLDDNCYSLLQAQLIHCYYLHKSRYFICSIFYTILGSLHFEKSVFNSLQYHWT